MLGVVKSFCLVGTEAVVVDVEVRVLGGQSQPRFTIIGLGGSAVREAKDRVLSALIHSGFRTPEHILANLAPAELKKEGTALDVPIALALLIAMGEVPASQVQNFLFLGELSLDGALKPVPGALPAALAGFQAGITRIILPSKNAPEAALLSGVQVIPADSILEILGILRGSEPPRKVEKAQSEFKLPNLDFAEVQGQEVAKRALTIAAAGGHNILMVGPPGCGKSMLAERLVTILPGLSAKERLEVVKILSVSGQPVERALAGIPPFRTPHHIISDAGLIGGGSVPVAGEITLAHRGVLFLDEFPEFRRSALEAMRAPLESGTVLISRSRSRVQFPARFQLVAAMNPCPCGKLGMTNPPCRCSRTAIQNYLARLSQPILDRIDLHVELDAVPIEALTRESKTIQVASEEIRKTVQKAREVQFNRSRCLNSDLRGTKAAELLRLASNHEKILSSASRRLGFSARGLMKILRVARTIADIEGSEKVESAHIAEAISFRSLERLQRMIEMNSSNQAVVRSSATTN